MSPVAHTHGDSKTSRNSRSSASPHGAGEEIPFQRRHNGPGPDQVVEMLETLGLGSLDELIDQAVPGAIRLGRALAFGDGIDEGLTERAALERLRHVGRKNRLFRSFLGMGYSGCVTPPVIQRNVLESPGWYTAYTPYQAEVSQGRLEALLTFQQMVADLTGLPLANASLLDEATAAAEAMAMARRVSRSKANAFFVDADTHPQTLAVIHTRARAFGWEVVVGDPAAELAQHQVFGALLSYPGSSGQVRDLRAVIERLHQQGALAVVACDLLALT
ncbi:MAG TPA: glycine dehydrogenase (aminomethyl-transferring), partial [Thermoanaerobaculia bacterium]|nr:glycine dehydrogenase (aminomethyl-transferring) [Thermoanaerobaculia bacterium]